MSDHPPNHSTYCPMCKREAEARDEAVLVEMLGTRIHDLLQRSNVAGGIAIGILDLIRPYLPAKPDAGLVQLESELHLQSDDKTGMYHQGVSDSFSAIVCQHTCAGAGKGVVDVSKALEHLDSALYYLNNDAMADPAIRPRIHAAIAALAQSKVSDGSAG